jgi:hypothetical protein
MRDTARPQGTAHKLRARVPCVVALYIVFSPVPSALAVCCSARARSTVLVHPSPSRPTMKARPSISCASSGRTCSSGALRMPSLVHFDVRNAQSLLLVPHTALFLNHTSFTSAGEKEIRGWDWGKLLAKAESSSQSSSSGSTHAPPPIAAPLPPFLAASFAHSACACLGSGHRG